MRDWVTVGQKTATIGRAHDWSLARSRSMPRLGLADARAGLVVAFVMAAESCIYVPIVSNYRDNWLHNRLAPPIPRHWCSKAGPRAMVPAAICRATAGQRRRAHHRPADTWHAAHSRRRPACRHAVDEFYDLRHSTFLQARPRPGAPISPATIASSPCSARRRWAAKRSK